MKSTNKIIASLVGAVLLITIAMVLVSSFRAFSQIEEATKARKHASLVVLHAEELLSELKDAETGQRGYLLTGDKAFLEPYLVVRDSISGHLKELHQLTVISAARKHLDAVAPLTDAKLAEMSHVIELRRNNDMTAVVATVSSGKGKRLMDSIRVEMKSFIQIEEDALTRHEADLQKNLRRMFVVIVTACLLILLFTLSFVYFIYRETQHRLKNIVHIETRHLLAIQEDTNKQLRQANITLQISEEKLAVTLNSIGDAVMATDAEGYVTLLNPIAEQLTGWLQAEAAGRPVEEIFRIINEETRQPANIPVRESLAHGTIQGLANHTILVARDGSERAIADSCAPIYSRDGQVVGTVLVFRDITERRVIEAGLEKTRKDLEIAKISGDETREYSESMINTVREPLIVLDQDLRVVTASRSFYEFFKVKPEETVGQLIYDLGNKQWDIPKLRELLETILPQKATFNDYEVEHDFATIGRRIMLLNARQIQRVLGKERIILLAIEDITVRKEIEAGLEKTRKELEVAKISEDETREYSESMINTVREPLIVLDQDLRVVTASRSFYEFFKVRPEETVGQLIYDLGNKQWDIPKLRELLETILPQKATFNDYEVEHDFATIGRRIMLLNARQIQRMLGKERIILLAIEDISERKEIEAGLKKAHEELMELASELERTTRVKSEFLANMSHELRTPLNAIIGFSEVLEDGLYGALNERQKTYALHIYNAGKHLLSLINDILDLSKVEAGKMEVEVSRFPIRAALDSSIVMLKEKALKHGLALSIEIDPEADIHIEADERKIKQILFNLMSNAVKFTPDGGRVTVRVRMAVFQNEDGEQRMLEVSIEDTGIGIKEEDLPRLFGEFTQLHQSVLTKKFEGTGLGLALTKRLVELHHGSIGAESEYGKGSRFYFTLPG